MSIIKKIIFFLFCCIATTSIYSQESEGIKTAYNFKNGNHVLKIWDSLSVSDQLYFKIISAQEWIPPMEYFYEKANKENDSTLSFNLKYPLAYIYHTTTKFEKCIPLLKSLAQNKNKLSSDIYQSVLLKLEECYIRIGNLKPAIDIRNQRIKEGFVNYFWEIYSEVGLYDEAIKDYKLFVKFPKENDWGKIAFYSRLGNLFFQNQQLDSAENYFLNAHTAAEYVIVNSNYTGKSSYSEYTKYYYSALMMGNIAEIYMQQKQFEKAIPFLKKDIEKSKSIAEISNAILKRLDLAECFLNLEKPQQAKPYLDTVKQLMNTTKFYNYDFRDSKLRADYFLKIKQSDSAAFYLNKYIVLKETIEERIRKNKALGLLALLDTDKQKATVANQRLELSIAKTKEAEQRVQKNLLYAGVLILLIISISIFYNNRQKSKRKKEIEKSLREKEILLKEIHHRVKNNLTTLKSLFYLQAKASDKEEVKLALEECQLRIQSMALIHQNLYEDNENERVGFQHFLNQLFHELELSIKPADKKIEIIFKGMETDLDMSVGLFLGLIINELATNSYKYAFNNIQNGKIEVELKTSGNDLFIIYTDNGSGLPFGFDVSKGGFGFKLISILADQINATISYKKEQNISQFKIEIPACIKT